jgi:glycosyltransferase involved in cell wall biosynthesis
MFRDSSWCSPGKFELRKGQDLVIRAFKVLADRHKDATLVTAWYNQWGFSWETMRLSNTSASRHKRTITSRPEPGPARQRHRSKPLHQSRANANQTFANIYRNTDVGIFPNRCEGGTNLVLMEYMACGRAVVASDNTGHADVVTRENALVIDSPTTTEIREPDGRSRRIGPSRTWSRPSSTWSSPIRTAIASASLVSAAHRIWPAGPGGKPPRAF